MGSGDSKQLDSSMETDKMKASIDDLTTHLRTLEERLRSDEDSISDFKQRIKNTRQHVKKDLHQVHDSQQEHSKNLERTTQELDSFRARLETLETTNHVDILQQSVESLNDTSQYEELEGKVDSNEAAEQCYVFPVYEYNEKSHIYYESMDNHDEKDIVIDDAMRQCASTDYSDCWYIFSKNGRAACATDRDAKSMTCVLPSDRCIL